MYFLLSVKLFLAFLSLIFYKPHFHKILIEENKNLDLFEYLFFLSCFLM